MGVEGGQCPSINANAGIMGRAANHVRGERTWGLESNRPGLEPNLGESLLAI